MDNGADFIAGCFGGIFYVLLFCLCRACTGFYNSEQLNLDKQSQTLVYHLHLQSHNVISIH